MSNFHPLEVVGHDSETQSRQYHLNYLVLFVLCQVILVFLTLSSGHLIRTR